MQTHRDHPLFRCHPLDGRATLSIGSVPTPYHVYDGHGVFVGGTADVGAVRRLLEGEQVQPVQTDGGRALMGIWVFDFTDASLGAHHELQFSLFASAGPVAPVASHRLGLIDAMLNRPDVQMLCHGLWNSSANAVAYNRELLALDARLSRSRIRRDGDTIDFEVDDETTGQPLISGHFERTRSPSLRAHLALLLRLGMRRVVQISRQPWIRMRVTNPVGPTLGRNACAESFTKAESSVLRFIDPARQRLSITDPRYRALDFVPQFFQAMDGFKFVYLFPR
jgi:hypothetical protein